MMKKILTALLAAAMLLSAAACKQNDTPDTPNTSDTSDTSADTSAGEDTTGGATTPDTTEKYDGSLTELVAEIYKKVPIELNVGNAEKIDISNADTVKYFTGLANADSIEELVVSEPMINAQAYSLCLVRAKADADISAIVKDIFDNVNTRKWVCVEADDLIVGNSGDVVMLIMTDSEFGETLASDLFDAFQEIVGADGEKLSK